MAQRRKRKGKVSSSNPKRVKISEPESVKVDPPAPVVIEAIPEVADASTRLALPLTILIPQLFPSHVPVQGAKKFTLGPRPSIGSLDDVFPHKDFRESFESALFFGGVERVQNVGSQELRR